MAEAQDRFTYTVVGWVANYLRRVRQSASAVLDRDLAQGMGARGKNWTQLVNALQALGVVDDDGRLTELGHELAHPSLDRQHQAAKRLLQENYPTLVKRIQGGEGLSTDTLYSYFHDLSKAVRGQPISRSGIVSASALFRFWVEQTGDEDWIAPVGSRSPRQKGNGAEARIGPQKKSLKKSGDSKGNEKVVTTTAGFEDVLSLSSKRFRVSIQAPQGTKLTEADWDYLKGQIEYLRKQENEPDKDS